MSRLHRVASTRDVPPGAGLCVEAAGRRIALFNVGGTYYALDDTCPHSGGPLSEGDLDGACVVCPWHGATFDLTDGSVLCPPAEEGVATYPVVVDADQISIELPT